MNAYGEDDSPIGNLRWAAEQRTTAEIHLRDALDTVNQAVHEARTAGIPVIAIAEAIGTTRQRVYEILREAVE